MGILKSARQIGLAAILAITGIIGIVPSAAAGPCTSATFDHYLVPGFECDLGNGAWRMFDLSLTYRGESPVVNSVEEAAANLLLLPSGNPEAASFEFVLLPPMNYVPASYQFQLWLEFTLQRLQPGGIIDASLRVPTKLAGPPDAWAGVSENLCVGTLFVSGKCANLLGPLGQLVEYSDGSGAMSSGASGVPVDNAYLIDTLTLISLFGHQSDPVEFPGGARIDSFQMTFRTVPEPDAGTLFGIGLVGIACAGLLRRTPHKIVL